MKDRQKQSQEEQTTLYLRETNKNEIQENKQKQGERKGRSHRGNGRGMKNCTARLRGGIQHR
jgi:hypothetical protein